MDEFRLLGQAELRTLLHQEQVDWKSVMVKAHELQLREEEIVEKLELEETRQRENEARGRRKRYDSFGRASRSRRTSNGYHDDDDEMSVGLLFPKVRGRAGSRTVDSPSDASYQTVSDNSSNESLNSDNRFGMRDYLQSNNASL